MNKNVSIKKWVDIYGSKILYFQIKIVLMEYKLRIIEVKYVKMVGMSCEVLGLEYYGCI